MAIKAIEILKSYFVRGAYPTESQFGDLLDSCYNSGSSADDKVKISENDTTNDYLNPKFTPGDEFTKEITNPAANETLTLKFKGWIYNAARTFKAILSAASLTADRTFTFPDKSITIGEDIHEPATEPAIVSGTPNTLTLDMNNAKQAIFEPRLSVGTRSINVDYTLSLSNAGNGRYFDKTVSLTGTRIISLPSDFRVSVASTIGTYDGVSSPKTLTLTCGTDDLIIMIAKYIKTEAVWDLSVNEITP